MDMEGLLEVYPKSLFVVWVRQPPLRSHLGQVGNIDPCLFSASSLPLLEVHYHEKHESLQTGQKFHCPLLGALSRSGFQVSGGLFRAVVERDNISSHCAHLGEMV